MRTIAAQFFQELDNLGDFVFAQDCELECQRFSMRVQLILVPLGDQDEHDEQKQKRKQGRRHFQPRKRRRIDGLESKPARHQVSGYPDDCAENGKHYEPRPTHTGRHAIHRAL